MTNQLVTPTQLVERNPWLKIGTLRKYLSKRDINGLAEYEAVIMLSARKLLIDESRFIEWVRSHT
ncbi:MAG: hypothetical protein J5J00_15305 [Deltaproteobacteria bacterium]|nr:hypothetical protein [Deltaproteobacteria bacterium]